MTSSKSRTSSKTQAINAINKEGICLVFPMNNQAQPKSLWSALYPRTKMRWEWDQDGDNRVVKLWQLRAELSTSAKVVYTKWWRGRATFFSLEVFCALLAFYQSASRRKILSPNAKLLLDCLEDSSPQSTKVLKKSSGLTGKIFEKSYTQSLKELWNHGWIVAWGEVDDGAFPSLAMGATSLLFEELWKKSQQMNSSDALQFLESKLGRENPFFKELLKLAPK